MPTKTISLEEAYGTQPEAAFPSLVPAERTRPSAQEESFLPGEGADSPLPKDSGLFNIIKGAADKYNVPDEIALALAQQESGYDPKVENEIGAKGLWQFIDATSQALKIDPFDPAQSSDAAMKEFAQQAKTKGIDWAIAHHFAGPNPKEHGPKTKAYVAQVKTRAEKIAKALGKDHASDTLIGQVLADEENPQTLKQPKPGQVISLEEAYGPVAGGKVQTAGPNGSFIENSLGQLADTGKHIFNSIKDRLANPPERVERTPEEVEFLVNQEFDKLPKTIFRDDPSEIEREKRVLRQKFKYTKPMSSEAEASTFQSARDQKAAEQLEQYNRTKDMPAWQQFLGTLENPIKLITEDSLPAHIASIMHNAPVQERIKYDKMRQELQRQKILADPNSYPDSVVQAAQQSEKATQEKQSPTVRDQWNALKDSALESPGMFAGQLVNALIADPEMLLAPVGFGAKPIQAARAALTGAKTSGRVIQLADRILDTGALGATLNTTIDLADQMANSTHLDSKELAFSAAAGAAISGTLGGILTRGAHAKIRNLDDAKLKGTYEDILKDQAAYDVEIERVARDELGPEVPSEVKDRINAALGITSKTNRARWIAQRRKDVRESFKNDSDYADYLAFKAEERITRTDQLASERSAAEAAAAEQQAAVEVGTAGSSVPPTPSGPSPGEVFRVLRKPGHLRTAEDMLVLKSIPKGQRGEVDPKLLARLAASGGIAAGAYGLAPDDKKVSTAILGGLAGLLIPGGGRVLSRMRQSGAVSMDGTLPGLAELVKDGKLKPDVDATAVRAGEAENLAKARQGDQTAFKKIYEDNFPRITRYVRSFLREAGPKLGIDAEDVAQDVFIQFFNSLDNFKGDSAVYTYLQSIAKNKALNEIQRSKTQRGGGEFKTTSMYNAGDDAGAGSAAAGHIVEGEKGLVRSGVEEASADFESPEFNAMYAEAQERLLKAVKKLPEAQRHILLLSQVDGKTLAEIAESLNVPLNTVKQYAMRATNALEEAIAKEYDAGKTLPSRSKGSVDPEFLVKAGLGLGVATVAATAGAKMFPNDPKKGALAGVMLAGLGVLSHKMGVGSRGRMGGRSRISQEGAFRGVGENFSDSTRWDLRGQLSKWESADGPLGQHSARMINNYLNKYAGKANDPLNDIRLPNGDRWEYLMDTAASKQKDTYGKSEYMLGAHAGESSRPFADRVSAMGQIRNYLAHVHDYLLTVPKEKLANYDFVRAVKETVKWDADNAKKMAKARAKSMEGMPVYKEYPDGFKWVQLKRPGEFAQESDMMGHSVRGYEPLPLKDPDNKVPWEAFDRINVGTATPEEVAKLWDVEINPEWKAEAKGGHDSYGFGGWEAIKSGRAKIYSLRNAEGKSFATIEVVSDNGLNEINQIKGPRNEKPSKEAMPHVQDFVKSGKWDSVDDLHNADMTEGPVRHNLPQGHGNQRGEVDPRILKAGAVAALGVGAYAFLDTENKKLAATIATLGGLGLLSRGRGGETLAKGLVNTIDHGLGAVSTRIMNISRPIWWRTIEHYRTVLRDTHKYMKDVDPFLVTLNHLPKEQQGFVTRAILTGNKSVTDRLISAIDNPELKASWEKVRNVLDSIGDQLVHLRRFKNKEVDYFPRIVTDYPGLLKALGKDRGDFLNRIVDDANKNSIRARGTELTELERSLVINKALMSEPKLGGQPGFAKDRVVKEITPELQKFYATPTESLHSYIRSAVEDIERAKFFGKDLEVVEKGGKEYTNVDKSVGKMVDGLLQSEKIDEKQAVDLSSMLKSLFLNGEKPSNEIIQKAKNLSYAGLLGNPVSAASQFGDAIIQTYIQGVRPAISSVVRSMTGRKFVSMKEFGLADHLAEEFVNTEGTAKFLKRMFKLGLFAQVDAFGKNVGLNAAISNFGRMVKSEGGIQGLQRKYGDVLQPQEFQQLVKDLQKGEVTDLVRSVAFAELSRTQPITRLEMPQAYLDNPNGRLLYQFKTFMLKQADVFRRDAYNEIKKGNVAKGIKNLVAFGTVLGISGATTSQIQNWIRGRDKEFEFSDIPMNMIKTFGMSEYVLDHMTGVSKEEAERRRNDGDTGARTTKAEPFQTAAGIITPPFKMLDEIIRADPNALRYIPVVGPILLENYKKRKAEETE